MENIMAKNFIQDAIKRPGALKAKAKKAGAINKKTGNIKDEWIDEKEKSPGVLGKEARLAKTLKKLRKKK